MPAHAISEEALAGLIRAGDSRRFKDIDLKNQRDAALRNAVQVANSGALNFSHLNKANIKGRPCFSLPCYGTNLTLRYVNRFLMRRLRIELPDRNMIVRDVISSLSDSTPIYAFRRDIESFYENLLVHPLKRKLLKGRLISSDVKRYLSQYFEFFCPDDRGLPRGIAVSAILAELAMQEYDSSVRNTPGVYRYFRYSDDILILCYKPDIIEQTIADLPPGLSFNLQKCKDISLRTLKKNEKFSLNYLGYEFSFPDSQKRNKPRNIVVKISDGKLRKIKTKIYLSFLDFSKTNDIRLLYDRLRFLSSNYKISRSGNTRQKRSNYIKSGIYYNYKLCGHYQDMICQSHDGDEIKKLDGFFHNQIKKNLIIIKSHRQGMQYLSALKKLSFWKGYIDRLTVKFTNTRVHIIKSKWRHV